MVEAMVPAITSNSELRSYYEIIKPRKDSRVAKVEKRGTAPIIVNRLSRCM